MEKHLVYLVSAEWSWAGVGVGGGVRRFKAFRTTQFHQPHSDLLFFTLEAIKLMVDGRDKTFTAL